METNYPSTHNQNWQDTLEPQLIKRLRRPLVQFGVTGNQLARAIQSRTQRVSNRLPLLAKLIHPLINNIGYFQFQLSPNDHILRLPDFDSNYESPDIAAAFDSQYPVNTSITDQVSYGNNPEKDHNWGVTKFALPVQAKHQVGYHSQPLSSVDVDRDDTFSTNNSKQNISLPKDAIATSRQTLISGQQIVHTLGDRSIASSPSHVLNINAQLYQRFQRPLLQPRLASIQLARTVQSRIQRLSNCLPLLTQLTQYQPHQKNLQVQKKSNNKIQRLPDFDSSNDLPELTLSADSQAIANANAAQFNTNNPKQNILLPKDQIATSRPILISGQQIVHTLGDRSITNSQPHLLDINTQVYKRLQRPLLQPRLASIQLARTVQSQIQRLSGRLPLLTQLTQHQPHKQDSQVQKKSNDEIHRLPNFISSKDLPELTVSADSQAIAKTIVPDQQASKVSTSDVYQNTKIAKTTIVPVKRRHQNTTNVEQFSKHNSKQNILFPKAKIATNRPIQNLGQDPQKNALSLLPSVTKNSGIATNTAQITSKLDLENQLQSKLLRPIVQSGVLNFKASRVVQSRIQRLSDRLPSLTQLAQHQPHKQDSQVQKKYNDEIRRLLDFDSGVNSPELVDISNSTAETFLPQQVHHINQKSKPSESATLQSSEANKLTIVQAKAKHQFTHEKFLKIGIRANLPSVSVVKSKGNGTTTTIPTHTIKQFIYQQKTLLPSSMVTQNSELVSSSIPMNAKEKTAQISASNSTPNHQVHSSEQQLQRRLQRPLVQSSIIGSQLVRTMQTQRQQLTKSQTLLAKLVQSQRSRYNNQTQLEPRIDVQRSPQILRHPTDSKVQATDKSSSINSSKFEVINRLQANEHQQKPITSYLAKGVSARQTRSNFTQQDLQLVKPITASKSKSSGFSGQADTNSQISTTPMTAIFNRTDYVARVQSLTPLQKIIFLTNENSQKIQRSSVRPLVKEIRRKKPPISGIMPLVVSHSSTFTHSRVKLQPTNNSVMSGTHNSFINRAQESANILSNSSKMNDTQSHTDNQNNSTTSREADRESVIDIDDLADRVMRKVMRQLAIESERRGGRQWP
ncbi:MAG: hypothetical protein RMZ43_035510 [Nostoc sp. CmiVER01]|uniref:hypothetical protein n=1 Tax=Nostoc sp. CmiVER01 TaxID=3075384 RepID=UPI002AD21200|nr:hypothetical protein [Nostoc sp. CmiVER01]MDZ8124255.1 hypothetical protein [Nostoc sp. CmiVER01]